MRNLKAELLFIAIQMGWYGERAKAVPVLIVGAPGVAKTSVLEQVGDVFTSHLRSVGLLKDNEKFEVMTNALPNTPPEMLDGIPVPSEDRTEVNRLPLAPLRRVLNAKYGMIFGDELSSASDETGASFLSFTQDGRAGDMVASSRVARVFAMNPPDQAAAGRELSIPEANRFLWINDWTIPKEDSQDFLHGGKGILNHVRMLPSDWEAKYGQQMLSTLALFYDRYPHLMNEAERNDLENGTTEVKEAKTSNLHGAWGSQRSWFNAARLTAAIMSLGESNQSELAILAVTGCVGERCADAWFSWLRDVNLPNPEELLADPVAAQALLPELSMRRKQCLELVAATALSQSYDLPERQKRWDAAFEVIGPTLQVRRDDAFGAVRMLCKRVPGVRNLEENKWLRLLCDIKEDLGLNFEHVGLRNR